MEGPVSLCGLPKLRAEPNTPPEPCHSTGDTISPIPLTQNISQPLRESPPFSTSTPLTLEPLPTPFNEAEHTYVSGQATGNAVSDHALEHSGFRDEERYHSPGPTLPADKGSAVSVSVSGTGFPIADEHHHTSPTSTFYPETDGAHSMHREHALIPNEHLTLLSAHVDELAIGSRTVFQSVQKAVERNVGEVALMRGEVHDIGKQFKEISELGTVFVLLCICC